MFGPIYITSLLGLIQLGICTALTIQVLRWAHRNPLGADGRDKFLPLQFLSLIIGLIMGVTVISYFRSPPWDELRRGYETPLFLVVIDVVACLSIVPAFGMVGRFGRKSNIVVLLSAIGIIPSLGAVALTPYLIFVGSAEC